MRYNGTGITSAKPLVFLLFILINFGKVNTWYIGCVEDQPILQVPQGLDSGSEEAQLSPGACCSSCLQAGYLYAAIQGESLCKCSNSSNIPIINEEYCNNFCDTGSNLLPCGGDNTLSVYSVKGPYLFSLELDKTQSLIQQDTSVLFEAKTILAQEPQEDDALPNLTGDANSLDEVDFVWFVGQSQWSADTRPSSNETIQANLVHTFLEEGEWTIGVQVRNPVSLLRAFTNVTVVQPVPSDLQVNLHPSQDDIPSCIPIQDGLPSASVATAAVFVGEEVLLQASLTMGINLTFQWSFSDDGSGEARTPYEEQPSCEGIACLRDSQVHTFTTEGVFNVFVNVSNTLGSVQKVLQVAVMNRDISSLNISLGEQTAFIRKLNSNINFVITMETAARSELIMEINFGDGSVYNHSLKDVNDTFILGGDQNPAHLYLSASYGEGCQLIVSLDHMYHSEGVFHPNVSVYSMLSSNITSRARLPQGLIIQRTLTGVGIDCHEVYSTNQSAILKVSVPTSTQNLSCAWAIYYQNMTQRTSTNCMFLYTFAQSGKYVFEVSVQNLVSRVNVERTVEVQDVVTGLQLESHVDRMVQSGSEVSVLAYVTGGTDVNFRWDFHDGANYLTQLSKFESNLYATAHIANHTYIANGHFNVSVTAYNLISSLQVYLPNGFIVQDAIQEITLPAMISTVHPDTTVIQATIHRGSHIEFHLDYGDGLITPFVVTIPGGLYLLHHLIPLAGSYAVTIIASNGVSSQNASTCVQVQEDIGSLSIFIYSPQEEHTLLVAHIDGVIPKRTDLAYTWHIDGSIQVSATPLLELNNITSDALHVLLVVSNQVATQEIQVDLQVPTHDAQLIHPVYAEVGSMLAFSTQIQSEKPRNLTIDYGDSSSPVFSTSTSSTFNWTHSYMTTGVYIMTLTLESDGEEMVVVSALSIQETLTPVSFDGPSISKFSRPVSHQIWDVIPQSGTDILYTWSVTKVTSTDGSSGHNIITSVAAFDTKLPISFHSYGDYNITLIASNALSTTSVTTLTTLQEAIDNVVVNFHPVLIGNPSELEIVIGSGSSLKFEIDFGDGSTLHITQLEESLSRGEIILTRLSPIVNKYSIRKQYLALGEYQCIVKLYNSVSEFSATVITQVEERISGLQLTSDSGAVMRTGEEVVMVATIDTGNDVIFEWFFDGQGIPAIENFHNKSIARYRFQEPGNFIVRVSVSNHLQQEPLVAFYPQSFIVQKPLIAASLVFGVNGPSTGAPLLDFPVGPATDPVEFRASCEGSHVVFEIDYGDGVRDLLPSHSENDVSIVSGFHVYRQEGMYTVSVHAYNNYGNASKTLSTPFYVQTAPTVRQFCPVLPCYNGRILAYEIGQSSNFTVQLVRGSHVYYNWSMGDQTDYLMHGKSVSHRYLSPGDYFVTVVVYNQVGSITVPPRRVIVQEQVQSVEIHVDELLNKAGSWINLRAIGALGAHEFVWDMGDGKAPVTRYTPEHQHIYHAAGTYAVTVTAKNYVSNATSEPVQLLIQEPIDRLSVILYGTSEDITKSCCSALIGQEIEIGTQEFAGSHMFFEWDFGDGRDGASGTELVVHHAYNRTGEFTVSVFASNAFNNATASRNVFILKEELCFPPPLSIVGGSQRKANFSDNIRFEIFISLVCESTDVVNYLWTLRDSDGNEVSTDASWASFDQRTAFIKHNNLPYGAYTLYLKATMNGTIVYSEDNINLFISATPMVAFIEGGTTRVVGNNTIVTLDGSKSYDLDYPDDTNFIYNWTCYQLATPTLPCFISTNESAALNTTRNRLIFHTDLLLLNETSGFVFDLKVGKEGRQTVETSQVLYIQDHNPVRVMVECTSCVNGIVNRNDLLTLNAVCNDCSVNATYTWKVYTVRDGALPEDYNYHCEIKGLNPAAPFLPVTTRTPVTMNDTNNNIDEDVNPGGDSFYNEIGTGPLDSFDEGPDQQGSFFEDVPETSFTEDVPPELPPDVSIAEDVPPPPDVPGLDEPSFYEEIPGDTGEVPGELPPGVGEETSDNSENMTYVEEVEATTIVYEYAETTPEEEVVEEGSYVEFEPSFVEDTFEPSIEEALPPQGSADEDTQPGGSIVEDYDVDEGNQTSSANDTSHTNSGDSEEESNTGPTSQPAEETTDVTEDGAPPVTGATSYIEYVYEYYYEEDIGGGFPTASYNTGGDVPSQTQQGSIPEYVPGGTSQAQPSNAYEETSIDEAGPAGPSLTEDVGGDYEWYPSYDYQEDIGDTNPGSGGGGGDDNSDQPEDGDNNNGDQVIDPDRPLQPGDHIVDKQRDEITLEGATTDLRGKSLTISRDFVDEGLTYAVEVTVDSHEGTREGIASQYIFVNVGPHHGGCSIGPTEGNELDQIFQANCYAWVDDDVTPLRMELSYRLNESDPKTVLYYGIDLDINFQLPAGFEQNDRRVLVDIVMEDSRGGRAAVCSVPLKVTPKMLAPGESKEQLMYNSTVPMDSKLVKYIHNGDHNKMLIQVLTIGDTLNQLPRLTTEDLTYTLTPADHERTMGGDHGEQMVEQKLLDIRRDVRKALLGSCRYLPMRDEVELMQRSFVLARSTAIPEELSVEAIILAAEVLDTCTETALMCSNEEGMEISDDILSDIINTASSIVDALALNHTQRMTLDDRKIVIHDATSALSKLLKTKLSSQEKDMTPICMETNSLKVLGAKVSSLSNQKFINSYTSVILPKNLDKELVRLNPSHNNDDQCQGIEVISFLQNPYSWGQGGEKITTAATSVELFSCDNEKLRVAGLQEEAGIVLEFHHTCHHVHDRHCNFTFSTEFMSVHQFNVTGQNIRRTFHISLELTNQGRTLPVRVLLRYGREPTPYSYDRKWLYTMTDSKLDIFLHPDEFNVTGTGVYYIALLDDTFDQEVYRGDVVKERPYRLRMWWGDCLYWKADKNSWLSDGCIALPTSTFEKTVCSCNHLTTFAVSFHPIVTTAKFIDLSMFLRPDTNAIPYSFVSALLGVYAFLFIYCYFADKHDEKKQGLIYLKDNQASDQQYYEITVETGFRTGAGTTARVSIVLHGDDGHSETKELICDDGRPLFERNSRDRFIVSVPESLGNVYKVLVWHNNGGISPSWYLSRVAVRDLITGHKWYFICERWFAVEEDDGKIERGIDVLKEGVGFSKAFWAKGAQYFADYYIWSSIFTRPPYSVFTRLQRLTCCLSISMGFLSICALRYYIMSDEDLELGLVDVSGEALLCGIIVALLAIPINFPVIMLFRRAKPNEPEKPEIFSGRRASDIYADSETTNASPEFIHEKIMRDGSWDSGMMDHHTMNTLQHLHAWARQKWKHRHKSSVFPPNRVAPIEMAVAASESTEQDLSDQQSVFDFGSVSSFDISDSGLSSSYNHSLNAFHHVCIPRHKKVTNPKVWLPHSFLYIAWGICIGIIVFSAIITSVIGYRFNQTKAIYWTQSVYFSFLQCIFVTQPAVMAMFTIVKSWRHRKNIKIFDHYDDNIDLVNRKSLHRSRLDLYENDLEKGIAARQRSRYLRFARPPQAKELQNAKERMLKEKNMYTILKDAILYSIVFVCLLWVAYGKDLKDHHPVNTAVINTFVKTPHPFTKISTVEELWHWLENDMVDTLYWETWYNGQKVIEDPGTLMNGANVLIGKASLRQLRVMPDTCHIAPEVRHLFEECHAGYSPKSQSKQSYGPDYAYFYQSKNELHRANKWGLFGNYEGDGYAINLNNSRADAARQIEQLKTNSWIDKQTRLVSVEFTLHNAPTDLFVSVVLMAEIPGTGGVYPFPKVESVLLYRYETAYDYFIICCEMMFLLLVAVTAKAEIHKAITLRKKYFYSMWSWLEMATIIIALTYFAMYVTRFIFVEEVIHRFHSTYLEEFVDVSSVAYWDQCIRDLIGSLLFLIGVKLLHLFRFNRTVAKFGAVLGAAIKEILLFALYYFLVEGAFACLGVLLLGTHYYPMKHFFKALEALTSSTVGHTPTEDHMDKHYPVWWPVYCVAHMICVFILLSSLIKAVICHSYKKMKNFDTEEVNAGELFKFFWDHFMAFCGCCQLNKESNNMGKNTLPTEFTMAEIEYQVDELLFKMNAMSHEHSMPEKCHSYLDDSDGTHGHGDGDSISYSSSEVHSYNQARLDERVQKIETNLYSANPELRELLDGVCLIDEDREKELRSQLEVEIFRQLQLQRQEETQQQGRVESTGDSGRDTQSVSDRFTNEELMRPRPLPSIRGEDGRISFPKPVPNLGSLDMQVSRLDSPNRFPNSRPAWSFSEPRKSSSTPDTMSQDYLDNDDLKDKHVTEKHVTEFGSALFVKRSSPHLSNTDGSGGELLNTRTNHPRLMKRRSPSARSKDRPPSSQLVSDYPEGTCHDKTISVDSFPLPNTLESLSSSSEEERKPAPRRKRKESGNVKRRLRKTRSQGKGKGRGRYGDDVKEEENPAAYMNAGYSSDSDESIPIIPMGPLKYTR